MNNKPMLSVERDSIALEALKVARQFIANGIELGFISMPEPETPDPVHDTLPMIDRAIAELKAAQHQGGVTLEQVIKAYDYANSHPHKYLRGTTNWCAAVAHSLNAEQPDPVAVLMPFAEKVISKLQRFHECSDDGQGADIGRHWFDLLTQLGLLNRVQRSPALWEITDQGEDVLGVARLNGVKP